MNLTIFGASGRIGSLLTKKALEKGDTVYAYVRNPDKLLIRDVNLHIITGQLTDEEAMTTAITNADVVISTLGPDMKGKSTDATTPVADGHVLIVNIMKKLRKKRLITLATPTLPADDDKKSLFLFLLRKLVPVILGHAVRDVLKIGEVVKQSDLDWTIIRIINPNLKSDGNGYCLAVGSEKYKVFVSRQNVANAFYEIAIEGSFIRQMPIVFNRGYFKYQRTQSRTRSD